MADDRFTLDRVKNEPDGHPSMPCVERHQNDRWEARGPEANCTSMELVSFPNGTVQSSVGRIGSPLGQGLQTIAVMIASNRQDLLESLLPRFAARQIIVGSARGRIAADDQQEGSGRPRAPVVG